MLTAITMMEKFDMNDRQRGAGKAPAMYKFVGTHDRLITGAMYSLREVALIVDISKKTMYSRMRGRTDIDDKQVDVVQDAFGGCNKPREGLYDRLEDSCMKLSGHWLKKDIRGINNGEK